MDLNCKYDYNMQEYKDEICEHGPYMYSFLLFFWMTLWHFVDRCAACSEIGVQCTFSQLCAVCATAPNVYNCWKLFN